MTVTRRQAEAHVPPAPALPSRVRCVVGTEPHRAPRRPPQSLEALSDRIRALQRAEPRVTGDERTMVLTELARLQLRTERLSLDAWRIDAEQPHTDAHAAALADQVDRLSIHWPLEAEPGAARPHLASAEGAAS